MRIPPALLFLAALLIALSAAIASGQTAGKTVKICEGLPIPEGYTIIGTTISPDCPKNTYLLKKDETVDSGDQSSSTPEASRVSEALRPRRVGSGAPPARNEPDQPARRQPPTLSGTTAVTRPPLQTAPAAPLKTGPEEVGDGDILHVDTTLVTVPVSVMDRNGKFIPNLRREDFHIFEDGVEQEITHFASTEKPFTVALLLDTSGSMSFHLSDIKDAAIAFANQLRPDDRMLVATFNDQVLLLTEATNNRALIRDVITYNAQTGDRTRLYDAIDLVIKERLNKIPGRKAIVLFTDGVDTASYLSSFESTTHEVEELDALIYPIQYDTYEEVRVRPNSGSVVTVNRSGWPFPRSGGSSVIIPSWPSGGRPPLGTSPAEYALADRYLHGLAEKTGARLYQANDTQQLTRAFSMIAEELRRQYSLSYYPKTPAQVAGERRQIKVRVSKPDLVVRARDNYVPNVPANTK